MVFRPSEGGWVDTLSLLGTFSNRGAGLAVRVHRGDGARPVVRRGGRRGRPAAAGPAVGHNWRRRGRSRGRTFPSLCQLALHVNAYLLDLVVDVRAVAPAHLPGVVVVRSVLGEPLCHPGALRCGTPRNFCAAPCIFRRVAESL